MLHIHLTDTQRAELHTLRRSELPAVPRDRLEMVLLSAAGWSPPRIAQHLRRHPHTVRAVLKGFAARGIPAFYPDQPGPQPNQARRQAIANKLTALLQQERTWTSRQLAEALGRDIGISPRQTLRYLASLKAGYRRTAQTVRHKQDPAKVEQARQVLDGLKKKSRQAGCGCSTSTNPASLPRSRRGTVGACAGSGSECRTSTPRAGE